MLMKSFPTKNNYLNTPPPSPINKQSTTDPIEDSANAKQSREMILQTKLIVVELLQVF